MVYSIATPETPRRTSETLVDPRRPSKSSEEPRVNLLNSLLKTSYEQLGAISINSIEFQSYSGALVAGLYKSELLGLVLLGWKLSRVVFRNLS